MIILKKNLYNNIIHQKKIYNIYTYNCMLYEQQFKVNLKKQNIYTIYLIKNENNKLSIKEISGILIKKSKMQNLTNLHLLCLKRYNNIYLSFFKEAPNILIKYK